MRHVAHSDRGNAEIMCRLHEFVNHCHSEASAWPANDAVMDAYGQFCLQCGLEEALPGQVDETRYTPKGVVCGARVASYLIGAHDLREIPLMLYAEGLADEDDVVAFYLAGYRDEVDLVPAVEILVRKAVRSWSGSTQTA